MWYLRYGNIVAIMRKSLIYKIRKMYSTLGGLRSLQDIKEKNYRSTHPYTNNANTHILVLRKH